ncbi:MAG: hypothetical protein AAF692_04145 [Pseudomonadota bacterium]
MRKIVLGTFAFLAACGTATAPVDEAVSEATSGFLAADGKPPVGVFDVTAPDGQVYREVLREDGTFSSTAADGSAVEGTWEMREKGVFCSKPKGAPDHVWRCKNEALNEDGVWTSTEVDGGEVSTVVRLETPVSSMAADGKPAEGFYRAVDETGFVLIEELREDGTYLFTDADGNFIEEGTYVQKTPQLPCFTPNAREAVEKCYFDEIGADGIWRTTDPDTGVVSVIERIEPEQAP